MVKANAVANIANDILSKVSILKCGICVSQFKIVTAQPPNKPNNPTVSNHSFAFKTTPKNIITIPKMVRITIGLV